jgi:hypothetical protein
LPSGSVLREGRTLFENLLPARHYVMHTSLSSFRSKPCAMARRMVSMESTR